jgi:hypothetical protein
MKDFSSLFDTYNLKSCVNYTLLSKEFHNKEVYYLRQELSKKNQDTLTLNKTLNIYQERVRILEEDIRNLVINIISYIIQHLNIFKN